MEKIDIYTHKEKYECDKCGKYHYIWDFDVFDRTNVESCKKVCKNCFEE